MLQINISLFIDLCSEQIFLEWLRHHLIPVMEKSALFHSIEYYKLLLPQTDTDSVTYSLQLKTSNNETESWLGELLTEETVRFNSSHKKELLFFISVLKRCR